MTTIRSFSWQVVVEVVAAEAHLMPLGEGVWVVVVVWRRLEDQVAGVVGVVYEKWVGLLVVWVWVVLWLVLRVCELMWSWVLEGDLEEGGVLVIMLKMTALR